jgi:hypothetical protein
VGRTRVWAVAAFVVVAALAVAATGRGGAHGAQAAACARGAQAARPAVPLPAGTFVASSRAGLAGYRIYSGSVPGSLRGARDWFRRELPSRGYRLGAGDAEEHEADTVFSGHGLVGHLRLRDLGGCRGTVSLEIAVHS